MLGSACASAYSDQQLCCSCADNIQLLHRTQLSNLISIESYPLVVHVSPRDWFYSDCNRQFD